jgi:cysteinyl-tRNA synthetase
MRVVLGTHHLIAAGGSDTYLVTVAEHLQRLGHEVTIHALEQGEMADRARGRGLPVAAGERELPEACEAVLSQDAVTAYELAERYPQATDYVTKMIVFIKKVLKEGYAYERSGSVYFDVVKYHAAHTYGKLFEVDFG